MPTGSKDKHILEDQDVRRWYENLEAKSVITATVYLRTLGLYCDLLKTTPKRILAEAPSKKFRDGFTDFIRKMEKDGKAGSYIERFKKVILSWTSYNNLDVKLKVNIKGSSEIRQSPTRGFRARTNSQESSGWHRQEDRFPSHQWRSAAEAESLGDYLGTDGIRLGDFSEAKIEDDGIEIREGSNYSAREGRLEQGKASLLYLRWERINHIHPRAPSRKSKVRGETNASEPSSGVRPEGRKEEPVLENDLGNERHQGGDSKGRLVVEALRSESLLRHGHDHRRVQRVNLSPIPSVPDGAQRGHGGQVFDQQGQAPSQHDRGDEGRLTKSASPFIHQGGISDRSD